MADEETINNVVEILKLGLKPEEQAAKLKEFEQSLKSAGKNIGDFSGIVQAAKKKLEELGESFTTTASRVAEFVKSKGLKDYLDIAAAGFDKLIQSSALANSGFTEGAAGMMYLIAAQSAAIPKETVLTAIGNQATESNLKIDEVINNVKGISKLPGLGKLEGLFDIAGTFLKAGESTRNFQLGLVGSAAASGQLNTLLDSMGGSLEGLDAKTLQFAESNRQIGNQTGYTGKQVGLWAQQLNKIPGALDQVIQNAAGAGQSMTMLEAAIRLTASTGMNFTEVTKQLEDSYLNFGTEGERALQVVTRMSAASQNLRLPLSLVQEYTKSSAQAFRFFGDNSQAALNILGKFGPALRESGLGPRAIQDLTAGMTQNIAQLGLAQRAFVSQSAGGPGGLRGAYQIEKLKREGKVDEVQAMVEKSLRQQFGGRVLTLDDATKDEGLASEFTKQVQLLTQGPTKIANSDAEAYAILEKMKRGESSAVTLPTAEKSMQEKIDLGTKAQDRVYDQSVRASNFLEKISVNTSMANEMMRRQLSGRDGMVGRVLDRAGVETLNDQANAATNFKLYGSNLDKNLQDPFQSLADTLQTFEGGRDLGNILKSSIQEFKSSIINGLAPAIEEQELKVPEERQGKVEIGREIDSQLYKADLPQAQRTQVIDNVLATQNAQVREASPMKGVIEYSVKCPSCQEKQMEGIAFTIVDNKLKAKDTNDRINLHVPG